MPWLCTQMLLSWKLLASNHGPQEVQGHWRWAMEQLTQPAQLHHRCWSLMCAPLAAG